MPKSRVGFWSRKIADNKKRDRRTLAGLRRLGWRSLVIWECQARDLDKVAKRVRKFLGDA